MAYYSSSGARAGLTCPHCGENQGRPMGTAPSVLYCRKCGKSFTRRMGEGIHRRNPKRKPLGKPSAATVQPAKRPSIVPTAPTASVRKPRGKA